MKNKVDTGIFNAKLGELITAYAAATTQEEQLRVESETFQLFGDAVDALQRKYQRLPKDFALTIRTSYHTSAGEVYKSSMWVGLTIIKEDCPDPWRKPPSAWRFAIKGYAEGDYDCEKIFACYRTPAQVETVVDMLKAAIKRGDTEFTFPTVKELTNAEH